jgi:hypothetical protein
MYAHQLQEQGVLADCHINICQLIDLPEFKTYQSELKYLLTDPDRIGYIAKLIEKISQSGNTLVLSSTSCLQSRTCQCNVLVAPL